VIFVKNVPHWDEFTSAFIWKTILNKNPDERRKFLKYFKNYEKTYPSR